MPDTAARSRHPRHAVVLGGSLAGLTAARALAGHFERVTVVDRDRPPVPGAPRRGVPQGRQIHLLLQAGQDALAELFPGLLEEMEADGIEPVDFAGDVAWKHFGRWKPRFPSDIRNYPQTRPVLEDRVRRRVVRTAGVDLAWGVAVDGLRFDPAGRRVTGVRATGADGRELTLEADLVVDAGGRGSRTPAWLAARGYRRPAEEAIEIGLAYVSGLFRRPPGFDPGWQGLYLPPRPPRVLRGSALLPVDGERWMVSLFGYAGDHPPVDLAGFLEFARGVDDPALSLALAGAELDGELSRFRIPRQVRRRYERLRRFPEGLLVTGDAACAFDPAFGQGMSAAAMQAVALDRLLRQRRRRRQSLDGLPRAFHRAAARIVDRPWAMVSTEAFRYPGVTGPRPAGLGLQLALGERLALTGAADPEVHRAYLRVMHLLDPMTALMRPRILWRVLRHALAERRGGSAARSAAATG